ncbi:MAG TPA: hypothetical protein VFT74_16150 [Isosphaeraceae bacterium]|nr:hypothetical protein [Isosphaeraceae bacterium]
MAVVNGKEEYVMELYVVCLDVDEHIHLVSPTLYRWKHEAEAEADRLREEAEANGDRSLYFAQPVTLREKA